MCPKAYGQHANAGDEATVRKMLMHAPLATEKARFTDPHVKAYALLQAHFSRTALSADMAADQRTVLLKATRLLQVLLCTIPSDTRLTVLAAAGCLQQLTHLCLEPGHKLAHCTAQGPLPFLQEQASIR